MEKLSEDSEDYPFDEFFKYLKENASKKKRNQ